MIGSVPLSAVALSAHARVKIDGRRTKISDRSDAHSIVPGSDQQCAIAAQITATIIATEPAATGCCTEI